MEKLLNVLEFEKTAYEETSCGYNTCSSGGSCQKCGGGHCGKCGGGVCAG